MSTVNHHSQHQAFQLQLQPQSSGTVPPLGAGAVTQVIVVNNPTQVASSSWVVSVWLTMQQPLRLRIKISFSVNGQPVVHTGEVKLNCIPLTKKKKKTHFFFYFKVFCLYSNFQVNNVPAHFF